MVSAHSSTVSVLDVRVAAGVTVSVCVVVEVGILVRVAVAVGACVDVPVGKEVAVGSGVDVGNCVAVGKGIEVSAAIGVGVGVTVGAGAQAASRIKEMPIKNCRMYLETCLDIITPLDICYNPVKRGTMKATITEILDDLRVADEITRRYERRFWLSSADFFKLYSQGLLDNGEHRKEFSEWSAYYQIKLDREMALETLSQERMHQFQVSENATIVIDPLEPALA